jgi:cell division septum initiation protein DivIVA
MSVQEIEDVLVQMSRDEREQVRAWLDEFEADAWDRQIGEDVKSGRLDALLRQARQEHEASRRKQPRPYALAAGEFAVPDDFDAPLSEELLLDFEGG